MGSNVHITELLPFPSSRDTTVDERSYREHNSMYLESGRIFPVELSYNCHSGMHERSVSAHLNNKSAACWLLRDAKGQIFKSAIHIASDK